MQVDKLGARLLFVARSEKSEKSLRPPFLSRSIDTPTTPDIQMQINA